MKLQILNGYASLCDQGNGAILDYRDKIILKSVEKTIKAWEKHLKYKLNKGEHANY